MADTKPTAPLDLSLFDNLDSSSAQALTVPSVAKLPAMADPRLAPEAQPERLVEIANLNQGDLAAKICRRKQAAAGPPHPRG
jgi:hypothetical protein